jgi:hypothetical protein
MDKRADRDSTREQRKVSRLSRVLVAAVGAASLAVGSDSSPADAAIAGVEFELKCTESSKKGVLHMTNEGPEDTRVDIRVVSSTGQIMEVGPLGARAGGGNIVGLPPEAEDGAWVATRGLEASAGTVDCKPNESIPVTTTIDTSTDTDDAPATSTPTSVAPTPPVSTTIVSGPSSLSPVNGEVQQSNLVHDGALSPALSQDVSPASSEGRPYPQARPATPSAGRIIALAG